ncbi:hypothetical protein DLAC_05378 [Tieghemostelium lacteum]|uniref:Transmembrane protein n=1 Tax=Tieghemostelium lacteum TaxID=361077 RepID=A0A151ZFQ1_TIELA|nr:hypothetical protein DLAC_05378 [Tieghemostelium lacteum]|eukprot:KYQ92796.1 hypothetical protein DLAC_05378 [Tieghemostelium lacteum]
MKTFKHSKDLTILILLIIALVVLVLSYHAYWYRIEDKDLGCTIYLKYSGQKVVTKGEHIITNWDNEQEDIKSIFIVCLICGVIGWTCIIILLLSQFANLFISSKSNRFLMNICSRVISFITIAFLLISILYFLNLPDTYADWSGKKFNFIQITDSIHTYPYVGWIFVCLSLITVMGSTILLFVSNSKQKKPKTIFNTFETVQQPLLSTDPLF